MTLPTAAPLRVDLMRNMLVVGDDWIHVKPKLAEVAYILARSPGAVVNEEGLWLGLYGGRPERDLPKTMNVIQVHISQLRKALRKWNKGVCVTIYKSRGYALECGRQTVGVRRTFKKDTDQVVNL